MIGQEEINLLPSFVLRLMVNTNFMDCFHLSSRMSDEGPLGTQAEALQAISSTEGLFLLPLTDIDNSVLISQTEKSCSVRGK